MGSNLPSTGLGALMPQTEFAASMIDWTHTNPLDSTEANRPRQVNGELQHLEQWILGPNPTDTPTYNDQSSLDTVPEPSQLLLDQNSTTETPARSADIEKTTATQDSGSGNHQITIEDDDATGTSTVATTTTTNTTNTSSRKSPVSPPEQTPPEQTPPEQTPPAAESPEPPKKRQRRRRSSGESGEGGGSTETSRAKNRLAAMRFRRKRKVEERGLEERQHRLHLQRTVLREAADALVHEVLALKHEVLRHATCGFRPLDHYIADAAARGSVSSTSL